MKQSNQQLEILRHSLSHVLAAAVKKLYPDVKFGIGPAIESGFYYDFDFSDVKTKETNESKVNESKITPEDLIKIEKVMREIIAKGLKFEKNEMEIDRAIAYESTRGQTYKAELLEGLKKEGEITATYYKLGDFSDLCRGPHLSSAKEIPLDAFKLSKLAGDEKNKMLTRIYGLAFGSKEELEGHLAFIEEAEKRDHRKIGKEQELFMVDQTVGLGLVMWHPKGALLWRIMEEFWYKAHLKNGYQLVRSPHLGSRKLWEISGHWGFYSDSMYPPLEVGLNLDQVQKGEKPEIKEEYLIKPMNCPFHVILYNSKIRSYRELPMRWAESATVYRYEKSGELSGLTRVRGFTQDDAHIICSKKQVKSELKRVVDFIIFMLGTFGFKDYKIYLSLRDPNNKKKYSGNDKGWEFTQKVLEDVAIEKKLDYVKEEGEAAFYGPKLDFKIKDALGREWQCSTLQFDFNIPERFDLTFINDKGSKERPYMLHRALFGSFERFIGVLLEHYAGALPVWLSPVQVKIISVGAGHVKYCHKLAKNLESKDVRAEVDDSNETVGNKIRKAVNEKTPYLIVIGDKEIQSKKLAVRDRGSDKIRECDIKGLVKEINAQYPKI